MIMTIARKLYFLIFSVVLAMSGLAILGIYQINKVYTAANFANVNTVPSIETLADASSAFSSTRIQLWKFLATKDADDKAQTLQKYKKAKDQLSDALNKYEKEDVSDDKDRALLAAVQSALAEYDGVASKVIELAQAGNDEGATQLLLSTQPQIAKSNKAFVDHREYNSKLGKDGADEAAALLKQAGLLSTIISLVAVIGIAALGLFLARQIAGSLGSAVKIAEAVADGDLTSQIVATGSDEVGQLLHALKKMNDNLTNIVGEVRAGTDTIATASGEIAAGNLDLSSRTEQQASALEETASSMEELTSTVKQNADNARQANQLAISASDVAVQGGEVVSQVVDTMNAINDSAKRIVDIIGVIDGIAFQTNILALNAAVEAARAGEQGRGFAVVAAEVRNLAQRSAGAAKEIKTLIDDSVGKVDAGSKLVDRAGVTMGEVVASVKRVSDIIAEISAASGEQEAGISQINLAITEMDNVTQQNAALVEQAAAAAGSLQDQAERMVDVVKVFKTHESMGAVARKYESALSAGSSKRASVQKIAAVPRAPTQVAAPRKPAAQVVNGGDWEEF
jgi:methyl-accepting chemotaxis protein